MEGYASMNFPASGTGTRAPVPPSEKTAIPGPTEELTKAGEYARLLLEAIRGDSAAGCLTSLSSLAARFPVPQELGLEAGFSLSATVESAPGGGDIGRLEGSAEPWYFSEKSMTRAFAVHLLRVGEKDTLRLIAETVRDESRIYPRPTDVRFFYDPPFSLGERDLRQALGMMELRPDMADIRRCSASNGAIYLYSTAYLKEPVAEALTEWIEVGQKDNP
jgi:hypothetical protein